MHIYKPNRVLVRPDESQNVKMEKKILEKGKQLLYVAMPFTIPSIDAICNSSRKRVQIIVRCIGQRVFVSCV